MKTIIFSIFLLLSSFCFGDWHSIDSYFNFGNGVSQKSVLDFRPHTQEFKSGIGKAIYMSKKLNRPSLIEDDLILGYINPDTVLTIEHDTTIYRNIALLNNAQLIVQNCTLNYRGDIFALDNSRLEFDNATLNLFQNYIYEFMIAALDSSRFIMTDCSIYSSNFPFGISAAMNGNIDFSNVDFDDAFATWSIMDDCSVTVNYADGAGEFVLIGDSSSLTISHSDSILIWLGFPQYSSGDVYDPRDSDGSVEHFEFPDSTCSGIDYSVILDTIPTLFLATMTQSNSDVTVYDADLLAAGNTFLGDVVDTISGIVNHTHYDDCTAPFADRTYRLVNSSVGAWNFYTFDSTDIDIENSIFGEFLSGDSSNASISNSICDGAGGHIGAWTNSFYFAAFSSIYTDALMEQNSISFFVYITFMAGQIIAKNSALIYTFNCNWINSPHVQDSAAIMVSSLYPPTPAYINDNIEIDGDAHILKTSDSPFDYAGYRILYAPMADTSDWIPITDRIGTSIDDSTLAIWNTMGLDVGQYYMRMCYYFQVNEMTDSVLPTIGVNLIHNTGIDDVKIPENIDIQIYPNPFNSSVAIAAPAGTKTEIYDIRGNAVGATRWVAQEKGDATHRPYIWHPDESITSGVYLVQAKFGNGQKITKRIVYLK